MNAIEFNGIWKKFRRGEKFNSLRDAIPSLFRKKSELEKGEFWALKDVSFQIKKGEVLGIIGPNGAGKSTVLKLLSGIIKPNKGSMRINGRLAALIEVGAGFHNDLTGRENIYLNGTILGMTKKEIDTKFDRIVDFSGMSEFIDTPVKRYSSGMYSRLGFSVAAHMDPDILLVDEVLSVGDMAFQSRCAEKMRELMASGATIILISHNLPLIQGLCKRVVLLGKGEVIKEGIPDEVIPYYESIVYSHKEEQLKKQINRVDYKVSISSEADLIIDDVVLLDTNRQVKQVLQSGDELTIRISVNGKKKIERPIVAVDIIRADGVVCCSINTKESGFVLNKGVEGKVVVSVCLGRLNLAAGLYILKVSVWDKDLVHAYAIRNKDIIRVQSQQFNGRITPVFLLKGQWDLS